MNKVLILCLVTFCMWTQSIIAQCPAVSPPYSENFDSYIPNCWTEGQGRLSNSTVLTGTSSLWNTQGFGNIGSTGAAGFNLWNTIHNEWLVSPSIDLGTGVTSYQLEFDIALTFHNSTASTTFDNDDTVAVLISTDNGATWENANILQTWVAGSEPSTIGDAIVIDLTGYAGIVKFGFHASSRLYIADTRIYIDNFKVRTPPSCPDPSALVANNITATTVDLNWTETGSATQWEVVYDTVGFPSGTGISTVTNNNPLSITGLTEGLNYEFHVRAICGTGDSSTWTGPAYFTPIATCPTPSTLTLINATSDSIGLIWAENGTATQWEVVYGVPGFMPNSGTGTSILTGSNPTTISGLAAATDYDFYVRAICGPNDSSTWVGPTSFSPANPCLAPSRLTITNVGFNTLDLLWTENGNATQWEVEYGNVGFVPGTGTSVIATNTPFTINGLGNPSNYDFYVRAICGPSGSSTWTGITTCPILTPAYSTNFTNFLPACWVEANSGNLNTGPTAIGAGTWEASSNNAAINLFTNNRTDWMISPEFDLSAGSWELTIEANAGDYVTFGTYSTTTFSGMGSDDSVQIAISTDGGSTWNSIYSWNTSNPLTLASNLITIDLSTYTGNAIFGIRGSDGSIDDAEDYFAIISNFEVRSKITSIESIPNLSKLNLYPNPTSNNAFLQLDLAEIADVTIQVTTVTGQSVLTKIVGTMQSEQIELPTATLPTGVYLVQINIGSKQVTRKLIISRN